MRVNLVVTFVFSGAVICGGPTLADPGRTVYGNALIGHLQPRRSQVSPDSLSERIEQRRVSTFDAKERKLDKALDKKLNICRC